MNKQSKSILFDLLLFPICFCISILIVLVFWEWNTTYHFISINILGTSVGFSDIGLITSLWLFLVFLAFYFKEIRYRHRRMKANLITIIIGVSFMISLNFLEAGWTSYPPLQALGQPIELTPERFQMMILGFRILVSILMCIIIIRWFQSRGKAVNRVFMK